MLVSDIHSPNCQFLFIYIYSFIYLFIYFTFDFFFFFGGVGQVLKVLCC